MIKKGFYPITVTWFSSEPGDVPSNNGGDWIPGLLASNEITKLPRDPKGGASTCGLWQRAYLYQSDGSGACYKLLSHCAAEAAGAFSPTDPFFDPVRPSYA